MWRLSRFKIDWQPHPGHAEHLVADYVTDGRAFAQTVVQVSKWEHKLVSPLGWTLPEYQSAYIDRLLLKTDAVLPSGRREILVCSECAGLGCGCISADIHREGDTLVWSAIGTENSDDEKSLSLFSMGAVRLAFDAFEKSLRNAASSW